MISKLRNSQNNLTLCQDASEDVVRIYVPVNIYFNRPAHGGSRVRSGLSQVLSRMFARNLVVGTKTPLADREMEVIMRKPLPHGDIT